MMRSKLSLSHENLLSANFGLLYPAQLLEANPGDTFRLSTSMLLRVAPLASPVFHLCDVRIHHFFVPKRVVYDDWEALFTGGDDGTSNPTYPTISLTAPAVGSLADYLGIPTGVNQTVSALPFRVYAAIWNEWYRDTQIQNPLTYSKASGNDTTTNLTLQYINWEKDRFTSARPQPQLGPEITVPLGTTAPVILNPSTSTGPVRARKKSDHAAWGVDTNVGQRGATAGELHPAGEPTENFVLDPQGSLLADLSIAASASIREYRIALATQRDVESKNLFGSRYTEVLAAKYGVKSPDMRLQLPEYIGGGSNYINFSEVMNTAGIPGQSVEVGKLYGHGIAGVRSRPLQYFCQEHGYIMTMVSVRPKTVYADGRERLWDLRTRYDHFDPLFVHIGQEPVYNSEVSVGHTDPTGIFGWQTIFDFLRHKENQVHGEFRTVLDDWHCARFFPAASDPALNDSFIKCNPPDRIFMDTSSDQMYMRVRNHTLVRSLVPAHAAPLTL